MRSAAADIAGRAAGFGMPAVKVDGDDFFAVHEAGGALERARGGGGPSAIEVDTCRFYGITPATRSCIAARTRCGGCARSATV